MKVMRLPALVAVVALLACNSSPGVRTRTTQGTQGVAMSPRSQESSSEPSSVVSAVDLSFERALLDEASVALKALDYATARAKAQEALAALLSRPEAEQDESWLELLDRGGQVALVGGEEAQGAGLVGSEDEAARCARRERSADLHDPRLGCLVLTGASE
jgi:hypothetical protein